MLGKVMKTAIKLCGTVLVGAKVFDIGRSFGYSEGMFDLLNIEKKEPGTIPIILNSIDNYADTCASAKNDPKSDMLYTARWIFSRDIYNSNILFKFRPIREFDMLVKNMSIIVARDQIRDNKVHNQMFYKEFLRYIYRKESNKHQYGTLEFYGGDDLDEEIMNDIAYNNGVLFYRKGNTCYMDGLDNRLKNLIQNFWSDYNLIAMDSGKSCLPLGYFSPDKFTDED